jgi:hypothetical protein
MPEQELKKKKTCEAQDDKQRIPLMSANGSRKGKPGGLPRSSTSSHKLQIHRMRRVRATTAIVFFPGKAGRQDADVHSTVPECDASAGEIVGR